MARTLADGTVVDDVFWTYCDEPGTHGGAGAGRMLKKIQAWLSIRRQGVRRR